jgi:hypothetical protein
MGRHPKPFAHSIERRWSSEPGAAEQVASVQDFLLAMATYHAACRRCPDNRIFLRQGGRVLQDSLKAERTEDDAP